MATKNGLLFIFWYSLSLSHHFPGISLVTKRFVKSLNGFDFRFLSFNERKAHLHLELKQNKIEHLHHNILLKWRTLYRISVLFFPSGATRTEKPKKRSREAPANVCPWWAAFSIRIIFSTPRSRSQSKIALHLSSGHFQRQLTHGQTTSFRSNEIVRSYKGREIGLWGKFIVEKLRGSEKLRRFVSQFVQEI